MTKSLHRGRRSKVQSGAKPRNPSRPHVLVDARGKLRGAVGVSELLAEHGVTTPLARLLSKQRTPDLREVISESREGASRSWTLPISKTPERALTFKVIAQSGGAVLQLQRLSVGPPCSRPLSYEIVATERGFGGLLAVYNGGQRLPTRGVRCHEHFNGSDAPCGGCPAQALPANGSGATGVLGSQDMPQWIVHARRISRTRAQMVCVPLEEAHVSRVVRGRIERVVRAARLSSREAGVLDLLFLGRGLDQIAAVLGITPRTVRFHVGNILAKIGADSRADLVRLLL